MSSLAVLTGDIVGSSALKYGVLKNVMKKISLLWNRNPLREFGRGGPISENEAAGFLHFSQRAGDGWQVVLKQPERALRIALAIRCRCHHLGIETRIAIATGAHSAPLPTDLNTASGPVFTNSGRLLDALPKYVLMAHHTGGSIGAAVILADQISQGWTKAQADAVYEALRPGAQTREDIARRLGKSRQAVDQALHAAGYPAIDAALKLVENNRPEQTA